MYTFTCQSLFLPVAVLSAVLAYSLEAHIWLSLFTHSLRSAFNASHSHPIKQSYSLHIMASPTVNGHPSTPPASDPAPAMPSQPTTLPTAPEMPLTSLADTGDSKRPRDARLIHLVLSSLGIHSYQERVPLQLLDFAYRYTSSVLSDSLRLSAEGYQGAERGASGRRGAGGDDGAITVTALRQAIASRTGYNFQAGGALPKEFMLEQAAERNRVALPKVERSYGVQLPPEKYCLTGTGWSLRDEWDSEEEVPSGPNGIGVTGREDARMGGMDGAMDEDEEEEGMGRMEDVFGEDANGGDTSMAEG
jgi:transcription initiation factor TFIID subunit 9B